MDDIVVTESKPEIRNSKSETRNSPHPVVPFAASGTPDSPSSSPGPQTQGAIHGGLKRPYVFRGEGTGLWQAFAWAMGRLISRVLSMLLFRLHVRGQAGLPRSGGVLLVTNHQSFLD